MIKIGILGAADIAYRMFLPSLLKSNKFECVGVASTNQDKRKKFENDFGIKCFDSYDELINNDQVDAVYIPLPPALHHKWAKKALENGKHVFLEKPSTTSFRDTSDLVELAKFKDLVIQENYMFQYHSQLKSIREFVESGIIGDIRLIKSSFGFPLREKDDFRYSKELGGGAILDAGGYVVKLANIMLGNSIKLMTATNNSIPGFNVDMYGSVTFTNDEKVIFQGSYGMDCFYQCSLEIWGSKGKLYTNRIFTAPETLQPILLIEKQNEKEEIILESDSHFSNSIEMFYEAIKNRQIRDRLAGELLLQAKLIDNLINFK